jgi:uncharacterized protein YndB with AHSA1/START domain
MSTATVKQAEQSVQLSQTFQFPVEQVYQAWTQPEAIRQWLGCDMKTKGVKMDLQVGGQWKILAESEEDNREFLIYGTYQEIIPNRKLVFTWSLDSAKIDTKDTLVTVTFRDLGNATEVTLTHERFANLEATEAHTYGWTISLETLDSYLQKAA